MKSEVKDDAMLKRAAAALLDAYITSLPLKEVHGMAPMVALKTGDMFLAGQVAEAMPNDSAAQLTALARIQLADGNSAKALKIAEKATRLFPDDAALKNLHEKIKSAP